jgi:putative MATE family efflux protein
MDARTTAMLESPPGPLLIRMATPNAVAFIIQGSVSLAEVWFIGQLGTSALAAIALAFPLLMLTQTMAGGAVGGAVTSAIARAVGSGDLLRAEKLIWHALAVTFGGAMLFLALYLCFGTPLLLFLGGAGLTLEQAQDYCLVLFCGGIFLWSLSIIGAIFRGTGDMKFPALLMIIAAFIQVPLSGLLVLGLFGFPQLGILGAAISAITGGVVVSSIMLFKLANGSQNLKIKWSACQLSLPLFRDIFKVALPASLSPILTVTTVLALTAIVSRFGESALAGYGIGSRIEFLMIPLVFGLGAAMTAMVGTNVGAGNIERAEKIGWIGSSFAAAISAVVGLTLALLPSLWIPAFTSDPETYEAAKLYIQILGPCFAFQGFGLSLYFASQGAGTVTWPIIATILRVLIAVAGALFLAFSLNYGLQGVYIAAAAGMIVFGVVIGIALKLGAWRK